MKRSIRILLTALLIVNVFAASAQITKALPEEFKEIKARPLIVEMLELDNAFIESRTEKLAKAKKQEAKDELQADIDNHKNFVSGFNEAIKAGVAKYWDLNKTVEYKTTSEVEKLRNAKNNQYTVLFFSESSTSVSNNGHTYRPGINLPTLNYTRIEKNMAKVDYSFFMPSTRLEGNEMSETDLIISLKIMKNHISEIEKSGQKGYTAKDFGKDQAKANCSKVQGKTLFLDKDFLKDNTTEAEVTSSNTNSKVEVVSYNEIQTAIRNGEDKVVTINIPWGIKASSGGAISVARVQYMKSLVNAGTGEIYYVNGASTGEMYDSNWRAKQISKIGDCK